MNVLWTSVRGFAFFEARCVPSFTAISGSWSEKPSTKKPFSCHVGYCEGWESTETQAEAS